MSSKAENAKHRLQLVEYNGEDVKLSTQTVLTADLRTDRNFSNIDRQKASKLVCSCLEVITISVKIADQRRILLSRVPGDEQLTAPELLQAANNLYGFRNEEPRTNRFPPNFIIFAKKRRFRPLFPDFIARCTPDFIF